MTSQTKPRVTSLAPQFLVDDLERSIAYYQRLGFSFGEPWGGFYAIGCLDGVSDAMRPVDFKTRRATPLDADGIAAAHSDSIRSIGPLFYSQENVNDWGAGLTSDLYVKAMQRGEAFFIAVGDLNGKPTVLGFAAHRVEGTQHGTAAYLMCTAAVRGIGSALFRLAEADAIAMGATSIHVEASLAAVAVYRANGFEEVGRGNHRLRAGRDMACVFMRKTLTTA